MEISTRIIMERRSIRFNRSFQQIEHASLICTFTVSTNFEPLKLVNKLIPTYYPKLNSFYEK